MWRKCSTIFIRRIQSVIDTAYIMEIRTANQQSQRLEISTKGSRHISTKSAFNQSAQTEDTIRADDSGLKEFMTVFPDVIQEVTIAAKKWDLTKTSDAANWLAKAVQYNVPRGKRNRGLLTISTYKLLNPQGTENDIQLAHYLGWCVEMMHALFIIADDYFDHSVTRRGQACWYTLPDVGVGIFTDCLVIEGSVHMLLRKFFSGHPNYMKIIELFHDASLISTIGESLDLYIADENLDAFTSDRYKSISHCKTAFYTFYLPVAAAMFFTGYIDTAKFAGVKEILNDIGHFYQVQDDYLDCFGNTDITGKIGTDIQDMKCTWLVIQCMERATNVQKDLLRQHYGQHDDHAVAIVKSLYKEMGLERLFLEYEEQLYNEVTLKIQKMPGDIPKSVFYHILNGIFRRSH